MKCEICNINDATRAVVKNVDGEGRELFVCDSCARTAPHSGPMSTSLTDVLFSLGMQVAPSEKIEDAVCPACGISRNEVRAKRRLGCPVCYDTFSTDVRTFLSVQQQPSGSRQQKAGEGGDIEKLKQELAKAVAEERYEDAASIMARIRAAAGDAGAEDDDGA